MWVEEGEEYMPMCTLCLHPELPCLLQAQHHIHDLQLCWCQTRHLGTDSASDPQQSFGGEVLQRIFCPIPGSSISTVLESLIAMVPHPNSGPTIKEEGCITLQGSARCFPSSSSHKIKPLYPSSKGLSPKGTLCFSLINTPMASTSLRC